MADLQRPTQLFDQLKEAFAKRDLAASAQLLGSVKIELTKLPALPPALQPSPNAQQQLALARQVLELAVLLSVKQKDEAAFERNFNQLRAYYTDARAALPPSDQETVLVSLNLLRLLVQNRIAEFHTELELLVPEVLAAAEVAQVVELEQQLMEGAYNKVLDARSRAASEYYSYFLDALSGTVRDEIASCSERAYQSLSVPDARALLMLGSDAEAEAYASARGWRVAGGRIMFGAGAGGSGMDEDKGAAAPSIDIINNCLAYAKELERIV